MLQQDRLSDRLGWGSRDLAPDDVRLLLTRAHDPDRDLDNGRPVETVLAGFGDIQRSLECHHVIHAWRLSQGRTVEAQAGQITMAARLLVHNQVKRAEHLLSTVDPAQWPTDRPGVIPVWLDMLRQHVKPGPVHKVYNAPAWRPWLNRPGPEGWAEGWNLLHWSGLAALGADVLPASKTIVLPKAGSSQNNPPLRMSQDVWAWQAGQTDDVPAAIAAQGQRLAAHWRTLTPSLDTATEVAMWLAGLGLVCDPHNALLSSVEVVHRLYAQAPDVAQGHDLIRHLSPLTRHLGRLTDAAWGVLPLGKAFPAVADEVLWQVLPGPRQIGNRPEYQKAVKAGWLHVLTAHPAWVQAHPLPEAVVNDLGTSRDPEIQAAWRQALATAVTPTPPTHRRRCRA